MKMGRIVVNFFEAKDDNDIEENTLHNRKTHISFQVADIFAASRNTKMIEIDYINISKDCRREGFGSELLNTFCQGKDDTIIIAGAGALKSEYEEEPTPEQYNELFENLGKFYTRNNFVDVTELFGTYDGTTKRTFLYKNDAGLKAIESREDFIKNN